MGGLISIYESWTGRDFFKVHEEFDKRLLISTGLNYHDLCRFYKCFQKIDVDKGGTIDLVELLNWMDLPLTEFSRRVFGVIDIDGSGDISFEEFVSITKKYCLLDKQALVGFAFDLYDQDRSGGIETKEMIEMCKDVYGEAFKHSFHAARIVAQVNRLTDPGMENPIFTAAKFAQFCDTHPGLLFPAFKFQNRLRTSIIGNRYWKSLDRRFASRDHTSGNADKELIQKLRLLDSMSTRNLNKKGDSDTIDFITKSKEAQRALARRHSGAQVRRSKALTLTPSSRGGKASEYNRHALGSGNQPINRDNPARRTARRRVSAAN